MSNPLKPFKADVCFYYKCPICETEYTQTLAEIQKVGKVLCGCGNLLNMQFIQKVIVTPVFRQSQKISKPQDNKNYVLLITELRKLGWTTKEAKNCIDIIKTKVDIINTPVDKLLPMCIAEFSTKPPKNC